MYVYMILEGGKRTKVGNEMRSGDKERKRRKGRGVKWG